MIFDKIADLAYPQDIAEDSQVSPSQVQETQIDLQNDKVVFPPYVRPKYLGRNPTLTVQVERDICASIARGNFQRTAALSLGIGERTFYKWIERYPEFKAAVEAAEAKAEQVSAEAVARQDPKYWLERGPAKKRWQKVETVEHTGDASPSGSVKLEAVLSVDELKTLLLLRTKLDIAEKAAGTEKKVLEAKPVGGAFEAHTDKP